MVIHLQVKSKPVNLNLEPTIHIVGADTSNQGNFAYFPPKNTRKATPWGVKCSSTLSGITGLALSECYANKAISFFFFPNVCLLLVLCVFPFL